MLTKEEKWGEMGFRTKINTLNAPNQLVLTMLPGPYMMASWEGVHGCGWKEVRDEKSWPCKSNKMGAEEVRGDVGAEWINEEREKDGCGGLNEELSEV